MSSSRVQLRSLLTETKDGEWGKEASFDDSVEMAVIRGTDFETVKNSHLNGVPVRHIASKAAARKQLQPFDILIETAGGSKGKPTGKTTFLRPALFEKSRLPITCASFARFMRVNRTLAEPEFIYWYLQYLYQNGVIENHQVQHTGIARFQFTKFADTTELYLPSRQAQKDLTAFFGALEERITLLRKTNATLEAIAQALFKSWFVDFDPVRAKLKGCAPEGMDEATAALFPDGFEESELGLVPRGWRVLGINQTCELGRGSSPRPIQKFMGGDVPWIKIADATASDGMFVFETKEMIIHDGVKNSVKVQPGDLIMSNSASCGITVFVELHGCIHDGWLYFKNYQQTSKNFLFFWLRKIADHLVHIADGSVQKNLNIALVSSQRIICPSPEVLRAFDSLVGPLLERVRENCIQAQTLATLRDILLPHLISGRLRLPEVEAIIEESIA